MDQSNNSDVITTSASSETAASDASITTSVVNPQLSTSRFEKTRQNLTEELSLKEISKMFTGNWLLFVLVFIALTMSSIGLYVFKIPYVASGTIIVNDTQNSSLQSFAAQYFGFNKIAADGKKNNSPLQKHVEYLKTQEYFEQILSDLQVYGESKEITVAEKKGYENFKKLYLAEPLTAESKAKLILKLDAMAKIKMNSEFQVTIAFSAMDREMALFLNNVALKTTAERLKQKELIEIIAVESSIKNQQNQAEKNMAAFNRQLADFQNKPENLISLSSKDKVGEYLSELMVRKNELRMKIAENMKVIDYLSQGKTGRRESQLYGNGGRIQTLKLENEMHQSKLSDIQKAIDNVTSQAKSIPVATQTFDELKKKSEIEFKSYKDATEMLAKIEAQKLSIQSRFEILEMGLIDSVLPLVSVPILLMLSFVMSIILGSLVIYIMYIWDSNSVTAHSSRDVVILDSHSLDPRVIMENTKIRFRLRNNQFSDDSDPMTDARSNKLSFKIFNKTNSSGDSK